MRTVKRCSYCRRILRGKVYIRCCKCPSADFCVYCFTQGLFIEPHTSNHRYRVIRPIEHAISGDLSWSGQQELDLIEGLEKCGMGNWSKIASYVDNKNARECETHCLTFMQETVSREMSAGSETPPPSISYTRHIPKDGIQPAPKRTKGYAAVLGYAPGRREFDHERNHNDMKTEEIIKDISFTLETTPLQKRINNALLRINADRLKERKIRKNCLIKRNFLKFGKAKKIDKNLLPLYKLSNNTEMEKFMEAKTYMQRCKSYMNQLKCARTLGCELLSEMNEPSTLSKVDQLIEKTSVKPSPNKAAAFKKKKKKTQQTSRNAPMRKSRRFLPKKPYETLGKECLTGKTMLTPDERSLCLRLCLSQFSYNIIKFHAIMGNFANTPRLISKIRSNLDVPDNVIVEVLRYFQKSNWIEKKHIPRGRY